ncbi:MAG: peptidyl-prolyl cis-trans isomerase [Rickettsiales bacterium]|jgi:parvulin-like peptidyl-prolyl isomerase|nr:peptidyl-prolyl cis-trans isomerase [Rickettsiales bacterium]
MKKLIIIALIFFYYQASKAEDFEIVIVAKVGIEVITNYDIMQRLRFISYQSGMQISEDNFTQLFFQTREVLIDEFIKKSAATSINIAINDEDIEEVISEMAIRNNLNNEAFKEKISSIIEMKLFREQIENQLLWQKYLYNKIYQDLNVGEYEIAEYIQSSANNKFYQYDIVNFFIGDDEEKTQQSAIDNYAKLQTAKISFEMLKSQFGNSALKQDQVITNYANNIDLAVLEQIEQLEIGGVSEPFKYKDSYVFLKLLNVKDESLVSNQEIKQKLLYNKFELKVKTLFENMKRQAFVERYN